MLKTVCSRKHVAVLGLILLLAAPMAAQTRPKSPSDTVRDFYRAMRERKFREAFALSIYKPAIELLTPAELQDLRADFERMAAAIPERVHVTGEQISGNSATVFIKREADATSEQKTEPVPLILVNGVWIVGDRENLAIVEKAGRDFFFNTRINTHHSDVQDMLTRISLAQVVYNQGHNGQFGNMADLIAAGLLPKDLEGTESTGYRFQVNRSADGKTWNATAEPAQYGKTGRLSFYLDASGVRSGDTAGKPLIPKN